jgi:hypothetical protein
MHQDSRRLYVVLDMVEGDFGYHGVIESLNTDRED